MRLPVTGDGALKNWCEFRINANLGIKSVDELTNAVLGHVIELRCARVHIASTTSPSLIPSGIPQSKVFPKLSHLALTACQFCKLAFHFAVLFELLGYIAKNSHGPDRIVVLIPQHSDRKFG